MTRIQIGRDQAMARTAAAAVRPGQTVLLVAGNGHVQRDLGVPLHLPPDLAHRSWWRWPGLRPMPRKPSARRCPPPPWSGAARHARRGITAPT
jgi:hypothetical protein